MAASKIKPVDEGAFEEWARQAPASIDLLERVQSAVSMLTAVPPGGSHDRRAEVLIELFRRMGISYDYQEPYKKFKERLIWRATQQDALARNLYASVTNALVDALGRGGQHPIAAHAMLSTQGLRCEVLRSRHLPWQDTAIVTYSQLPEGHAIRAALPVEEAFLETFFYPTKRIVILGPAISSPLYRDRDSQLVAPPLVMLADVLKVTRDLEVKRAAEQRRLDRAAELNAEAENRRRLSHPAVRMEILELELEKLKKELEIHKLEEQEAKAQTPAPVEESAHAL